MTFVQIPGHGFFRRILSFCTLILSRIVREKCFRARLHCICHHAVRTVILLLLAAAACGFTVPLFWWSHTAKFVEPQSAGIAKSRIFKAFARRGISGLFHAFPNDKAGDFTSLRIPLEWLYTDCLSFPFDFIKWRRFAVHMLYVQLTPSRGFYRAAVITIRWHISFRERFLESLLDDDTTLGPRA